MSKAVEKEWGVIKHPTIEELALMVLSQADRQGWDNIVLWKMDLANAFGLLFLFASCARLMAFELTCGVTAIYIVIDGLHRLVS